MRDKERSKKAVKTAVILCLCAVTVVVFVVFCVFQMNRMTKERFLSEIEPLKEDFTVVADYLQNNPDTYFSDRETIDIREISEQLKTQWSGKKDRQVLLSAERILSYDSPKLIALFKLSDWFNVPEFCEPEYLL